MQPVMRMYRDEDDYWRIRAFLRQVFFLNGRREWSWQVARLDYWRWHGIENQLDFDSLDGLIYLWETSQGEIAAVLNPEGKGEAFLHVHPGQRTPELEEEMIVVAQERLAELVGEGRKKLAVWAPADDVLRRGILARLGYTVGTWPEHKRQRSLEVPIPGPPLPDGYLVRALGGPEELSARSWASWRGFHPNEPDSDYDHDWTWYQNVQQAPLYRRDLDIVAVAPGGEIAAFCTLWYDDVTRTGYFEPVATVPEHQRRGLGKAVMCEAMRRVKRMGATLVTVGGFSAAANALYASVMSPGHMLLEPWVREW